MEFICATDAVTVTTKRTAPTNLQASATTSSSTVLNWTAPTDVTDVVGYNVYNGDELGMPLRVLKLTTSNWTYFSALATLTVKK
jgi:hypothetical protein